eukprot:361298-Chlamydomonas_euryale.AAC.2
MQGLRNATSAFLRSPHAQPYRAPHPQPAHASSPARPLDSHPCNSPHHSHTHNLLMHPRPPPVDSHSWSCPHLHSPHAGASHHAGAARTFPRTHTFALSTPPTLPNTLHTGARHHAGLAHGLCAPADARRRWHASAAAARAARRPCPLCAPARRRRRGGSDPGGSRRAPARPHDSRACRGPSETACNAAGRQHAP